MNSTTNLIQQLPSIASLDKRVTVQTLTTTRGAAGGEVITWSDLRTVWAMVEYMATGNDETIIGDQPTVMYRTRITMRYQGDVTEKMRIVYNVDGTNTDTFDIVYKEILGRRQFERFTCISVS